MYRVRMTDVYKRQRCRKSHVRPLTGHLRSGNHRSCVSYIYVCVFVNCILVCMPSKTKINLSIYLGIYLVCDLHVRGIVRDVVLV